MKDNYLEELHLVMKACGIDNLISGHQFLFNLIMEMSKVFTPEELRTLFAINYIIMCNAYDDGKGLERAITDMKNAFETCAKDKADYESRKN